MKKTLKETIIRERDLIKEKMEDLRDPFNAIKIAQYFLRKRLENANNEKISKHLDIINKHIDRAYSKLNDIIQMIDENDG